MLDDLNELRTFQRILACGSLSAAARDLGVGLAVVSKRLASLEQRAGNRLINRTTRRLSPTNEGLALAPHVDRMLEELAAAEARLASGWEEPHGLLRVSAPISFGRIHLIPLAAALIERYPRLDIELKLEDRVVDLTDEQIDIAVRIGQPRDSSAIMRKLADNRRILVAAPAYLNYDDHAVPWRLEGPDAAIVDFEPRCRLRANSGDAVTDWALAGQGVMLKSAIDVVKELAAGRLEQLLPDWRSAAAPIYALMPSRRHLSTKSRAFLDALSASLAALPGPSNAASP
jgi:LysR family transcriptional activator of dmlA